MLRYVGEEVERVKGLFDEKERRLVGEAQAAAGAAAKQVPAPILLQCSTSCHMQAHLITITSSCKQASAEGSLQDPTSTWLLQRGP